MLISPACLQEIVLKRGGKRAGYSLKSSRIEGCREKAVSLPALLYPTFPTVPTPPQFCLYCMKKSQEDFLTQPTCLTMCNTLRLVNLCGFLRQPPWADLPFRKPLDPSPMVWNVIYFSLLRQWGYVHEHRKLPSKNGVLLIRSQLHLLTGVPDSLKIRKKPQPLYVFSSFVS